MQSDNYWCALLKHINKNAEKKTECFDILTLVNIDYYIIYTFEKYNNIKKKHFI